MVDINTYNDTIISLYKQGLSIDFITKTLYKKLNTKLKQYNKKSGGELWVIIPKYSHIYCRSHVYKVILKYKKEEIGGN